MVSISCFYNHYNRTPYNFTFIQFDKYVKVIINYRAIILTYDMLISNKKLFEFFILSLLCTKDTETISIIDNKYGVITQHYWKHLRFTDYYEYEILSKSYHRSPLNAKEPTRISSSKKIKKFNKLFNTYMSDRIDNPVKLIEEYISLEIGEYIDYFNRFNSYNSKITALSMVLHNYGTDIYSCIADYL